VPATIPDTAGSTTSTKKRSERRKARNTTATPSDDTATIQCTSRRMPASAATAKRFRAALLERERNRARGGDLRECAVDRREQARLRLGVERRMDRGEEQHANWWSGVTKPP